MYVLLEISLMVSGLINFLKYSEQIWTYLKQQHWKRETKEHKMMEKWRMNLKKTGNAAMKFKKWFVTKTKSQGSGFKKMHATSN